MRTGPRAPTLPHARRRRCRPGRRRGRRGRRTCAGPGDWARPGAFGAARLLGVIPVPAKITAKSGRSWTWPVGPATLAHRVIDRERGCTVAIDLRAPGPLEPLLAATYGPIIQLM